MKNVKKKKVKKIKNFEENDNFKKGIMTREATVVEALPGNVYKVLLKEGSKPIIGYLSGNMVRNFIRLIKEDLVVVELSVFDKKRCRIVFRK